MVKEQVHKKVKEQVHEEVKEIAHPDGYVTRDDKTFLKEVKCPYVLHFDPKWYLVSDNGENSLHSFVQDSNDSNI